MRLAERIAILPICALLLCLSACDWGPSAEGRFERTLNVSGAADLEVTTGSGSIEVRTGASSAVQVYGHIRAGNDFRSDAQEKVRYLEANPPIEQAGNVIRIGRINNATYSNNVGISYELVVPPETKVHATTGSGSLEIEGVRSTAVGTTGSGSISMRNIGDDVTAHTGSGSIKLSQIDGEVEARTGSGSIEAEYIAGTVRMQTGSGGITLQQTEGGTRDAELRTGSGSIEASGINGSLIAHSGSGGITASGHPAGDWKVEVSSGPVTLHMGAEAAFDLVARASSGSITVDHPITVSGVTSKREMRGQVRGGGRLVDVHVGSGSITIR